jgi:hypothetical protein
MSELMDKVFRTLPASEWAGAPLDFWQALRPCAWLSDNPDARYRPDGAAIHALRIASMTWDAIGAISGERRDPLRRRYARWCAETGTAPAQIVREAVITLAVRNRAARRLERHLAAIREEL